jgi:hypothetical protein
MATFEVRVEGLTGLNIDGSSSPTQDELSEYLKDGTIDVTNRCIAVKPQDSEQFSRLASSDSQGVEFGRGKIISVLREAGADGSSDGSTAWRECHKVAISLQSRVVDTNSIYYASQYNPAYVIDDTGVVNVYPVPSSNNGIQVYYINNTPVNGSGSSLVYSHDDIKYFPSDKIYLVVIYAGIRSLQNALSGKNADFPNDVISFAMPALPADADVDFTNVGSILTFTPPAVSPDFADANTWINTEEDAEMSAARAQIIGTQLQEYNSNIQKELQVVTTSISDFQAETTKAMQKYTAETGYDLKKYQAEVATAIQKYTNDVQNYTAKIQKVAADYGWMEKRMMKLQQEYDAAFAINAPKQQKPQGAR